MKKDNAEQPNFLALIKKGKEVKEDAVIENKKITQFSKEKNVKDGLATSIQLRNKGGKIDKISGDNLVKMVMSIGTNQQKIDLVNELSGILDIDAISINKNINKLSNEEKNKLYGMNTLSKIAHKQELAKLLANNKIKEVKDTNNIEEGLTYGL